MLYYARCLIDWTTPNAGIADVRVIHEELKLLLEAQLAYTCILKELSARYLIQQ